MEFTRYKVIEEHPVIDDELNCPATPIARCTSRSNLYISTGSHESNASSFESGYCLSHYGSTSSCASSHCEDSCSEAESVASSCTVLRGHSRKPSLLSRALSLSPRGQDKSLDDYPDPNVSGKFTRSRSTGNCSSSFFPYKAELNAKRKSFNNFLFIEDEASEVRGVRFLKCRNCKKVFSGADNKADFGGKSETGTHRHLFCSGECYISLYAVAHAAQQRKQQELRHLRQQRIQQMQAQREQAVFNRPEGA